MVSKLKLGDISVDVILKDIKNVHLSVYPPTGRVRISAPAHMSLDAIRVFAISKLDWIKKQQAKLRAQERETRREYLERESHYVWGRRYLLRIIESEQPPKVRLEHGRMTLVVRPGSREAARAGIVAKWYREQIKAFALPLIAKWESQLGVNVEGFFVQQMKTKWGSCNPRARHIRLNTELAKKPRECLEYIVVHEMAHLVEPTHNPHFLALMDRVMPHWKDLRDELNSAPLAHVEWKY